MPIGTAVHERTFALCESLNYREWSGYYAVSAYEGHHEHEYNAIRNAAALIDVSPLFKYLVTGRRRGAVRRPADHARRVEDGDRPGVLHALVRRARPGHRRWDGGAAGGADVPLDRRRSEPALVSPERRRASTSTIEDVSEEVAALALQGPTSARLLRAVCRRRHRPAEVLPRDAAGRSPASAVDISRTGYTGDLGYEIWIPARHAVRVWDALMAAGKPFDIKPAGMLALDVARVEAGLLLDRRRLLQQQESADRSQTVLAVRDGARPAGQPRQRPLHRPAGAARGARARAGAAGRRAGDRLDRGRAHLRDARACRRRSARPPRASPCRCTAARRQVGRATTTTWSPVLKQMIALATVDRPHYADGTRLQIEMTVEAVRHRVAATVVKTPFFNPRKTRRRR